MKMKEEVFRTVLTTKGRVSGRPHSVELRAVSHDGKVYVSRHRPDGDWFKNAIKSPAVRIEYDGQTYSGTARQITDEKLNKRISELKYSGEERAKEKRVTIEITIKEEEE